ncbi:signal transduction histidine kinase [Candidatus Scalindua japonica]|uniref:histidine kinase n=1 Tax=Candidatus Scalindua japonica TaxID=1284222 RepID=A0A286U1W5_9BACT|nr:PAS domain S-box protein [Candidatus Scalindua japonica]GAX62143.1 signal transduction histidine kinase [Candidatus Scalindua japonica]
MQGKPYTDLRKEAEFRLKSDTIDIKKLSDEDVRSLAHELQIHQIELEMQNEELHKAQLQVEGLLRKYSDLYNFAPVGYFTTNEKGLILETNLRGASMLGIERSLLIKKYLTVVKEDQDIYYLYRKKCLETGNREWCELRIDIHGGGQFYALLESIAVQDADGNFGRIRTIVTDITERKLAEEELARSETKYSNLIETAQDAIVCDLDQVITVWNKSAERLFGYSKEEIIGRPVSILIPEKYKKEHREGIERFLKTGESRIMGKTVELTGMTKEGIEVPLELSLTHQKIDNRQYFFTAIVRDITGRKEVMSALKQSEEQYRTLVQAMPDIIYKVDENGFFVFLNDSVRTLGYEPGDLIGKHFSTIVHPDNVKSFSRIMLLNERSDKKSGDEDVPKLFDERRTRERMTHSLKLRLVAKSNDLLKTHVPGKSSSTTLFCEITATGIYFDVDKNREFHGTVGIISDITDKIELQQEVVRAGQLALIGEMAAGLAHEINNPVYGIINYAQLIVDESDKDNRIHEFGKLIMEEGSRIADMTRNLLTLSRDKTNEKGTIQIDELITSSLKLSETQLKKDEIIIKVNIPEDIPAVFADPREMKQVFLNLIHNARYALNEKYSGKDKEKILEISCKKASIDGCRYIQIIFRDRGVGIPESIINNITSPFFTTKPPSKGTGIGLSICNSIINNNNGKMVIESDSGIFTKVIISLPAKKVEMKE